VISNQSGVARGFLSEKDLVPIHDKLRQELGREGARVDAIYYCPHHPTAGAPPYNRECECRKPKPGMLLRGAKEFSIEFERSFVVGDSLVDMQVGASVGAATVLVLTGYGKTALEACRQLQIRVDKVAETITEAVDFIAESLKGEAIRHE
jgi:D-glycero-D-manno-heptose 1,7-bisphosphate phosphatase